MMADLELKDIGSKVKILRPHLYHHKNEAGVIKGRDSMPTSRFIWWVEARNYGDYYAEEELKLLSPPLPEKRQK